MTRIAFIRAGRYGFTQKRVGNLPESSAVGMACRLNELIAAQQQRLDDYLP